MSSVPEDLHFAKTHEWVRREDDGTLTMGISDHAQEALGDLVFVELPEEGAQFDASQEIAVVESVKAASDVYCPVAGTVVESNAAVVDSPEVVNGDPYGAGWLVRLRPERPDDVAKLMDAATYTEFAAQDEH